MNATRRTRQSLPASVSTLESVTANAATLPAKVSAPPHERSTAFVRMHFGLPVNGAELTRQGSGAFLRGARSLRGKAKILRLGAEGRLALSTRIPVLVAAALCAIGAQADAQTVYTYSTTSTSTSWTTPGNWTVAPGTTISTRFPGDGSGTVAAEGTSTDIAAFGPVASQVASLGLNFNTVNGSLTLGAIDFLSSVTRNIAIGNSSGAAGQTNATLALTGQTLNGTANTILSNAGSFLLTLQPRQGGNFDMSVALSNATNNVVQINSSGGITISSVIKDGAGTKLTLRGGGTGALTLSGANTYTGGTSVALGKLSVTNATGTSATGTSGVAVGDGTGVNSGTATLSGTGFISGLVTTMTTGANTAHVAAGVNTTGANNNFGSVGNLTLNGGLTIGTDTHFDFDLASTTTLTSNDRITLGSTSTLTLGSAFTIDYNLLTANTLATTGTYTLFTGSSNSLSLAGLTISSTGLGSYTPTYSVSGNSLLVGFSLPAATPNYFDTNGSVPGIGINGGTAVWDTGTMNWNPLVTGDGNPKVFDSTQTAYFGASGGGTAGTVTIPTGGVTANAGVQFDVTGYTITGATLTLGGTPTITVSNAADTATISSVIAGTAGLTKAGAGILTLSGTTANTYSGTTTVNAGELDLNKSATVNAITGALTIGDNSGTDTVKLLASDQIANSSDVTINAGGVLNLNGSSETIDGLSSTVATSSVLLGSGTLTVGSSNEATLNTFAGIISGSGNFTKIGTGTQTLSGSNTYSGLTTISAGTLKLGAAGDATNTPLGTTDAGTVVGATGAALDLGGFTLGTAEALTLNGTGVGSGGALMNSGGAATYSGLIALGGASSIVANSGNIILSNSGTITGPTFGLTLSGTATGSSLASIIGTGSGTLTKTGSGTWTLSGVNTYTGLTSITVGTLTEGVSDAIGSGDVTINGATAVFNLGADHTDTVGVVTLQGGGQITGTGTSTLTSTSAFAMQNGTVSAILGGNVGLNKTTSSTVTLSGVNTYTGLTNITAGTLTEGVSNAIGSGDVTINGSNAVLSLGADHSDTVGVVTLQNSGQITGTGTSTLTSTSAFETQSGTVTAILGGSVGLNKSTTGTVTLSGANTYTGLTTISGGILKLGVSGNATNTPLGTTDAGSVVIAGALDLGGFTLGTAEALTLNGTGVSGGGALTNSGAAATYSGLITLGSASSIVSGTATTNNIVISNTGTITGSGFGLTLSGAGTASSVASIIGTGAGTLTKSGTGTWTLSGANTYTGLTTISAGTLALSGGSAIIDTGAVTLSSNGILQLNASETIGALNGATGNTIALQGNTLTFGDATATTSFLGNITGTGPSSLIKQGSGTATVNASGTSYTGSLTIREGVLATPGSYFGSNGSTVFIEAGTLRYTATNTETGRNLLQLSSTSSAVDVVGASVVYTPGVISGAGTLNKTGIGTLNLGAGNSFAGGLVVSGGTAALTATNALPDVGPINVSGGTLALTTFSDTVGAVTLTSGTISGTSGVLTASSYAVQSGSISATLGGTGGLTKTNTTGTVSLSGSAANTYSGLTTVSEGTLSLSKSTAGLNAVGGDVTINGGTVSYGTAINEQISNSAAVTLSSGTFDVAARAETIGSLAISGGELIKGGAALTVTGASSIIGGTVTLTAGASTVALNGSLTLGGANFRYTSTATPDTTNGLILGGVVTYAASNTASATFTNSNTGVGRVDLGGATRTFDIANSSTLAAGAPEVSIAWSVQNGGLTKTGDGAMQLSANNTFTGATTVNAGTLEAASTSGQSLGTTSAVNLNGGSLLLGGSNQIGDTAAVNLAGGTFDLNGRSEVVTPLSATSNGVGTLTLTATSTLDFGAMLEGDSIVQFLAVGGASSLNDNIILQITNWAGTPNAGGGAERLLFSGSDIAAFTSVFGQNEVSFNGAFGYAAIQFNAGGVATDDYYEVTSADMQPIPEPGTVFGGLALLGIVAYRERRRVAAGWAAWRQKCA